MIMKCYITASIPDHEFLRGESTFLLTVHSVHFLGRVGALTEQERITTSITPGSHCQRPKAEKRAGFIHYLQKLQRATKASEIFSAFFSPPAGSNANRRADVPRCAQHLNERTQANNPLTVRAWRYTCVTVSNV